MIEFYKSIHTGEGIDRKLTNSLQCDRLTQAEYDAKLKDGDIDIYTWYLIYRDYAKTYLERVYVGKLLFAKRGDKASVGFPYVFPIIFV